MHVKIYDENIRVLSTKFLEDIFHFYTIKAKVVFIKDYLMALIKSPGYVKLKENISCISQLQQFSGRKTYFLDIGTHQNNNDICWTNSFEFSKNEFFGIKMNSKADWISGWKVQKKRERMVK